MSVSQFPTPASVAHPAEPSGPYYLKLLQLPDEYAGIVVKVMVDGGATYGGDTTNVIRRWRLEYNGLTSTQLGVLTAHFTEALGILLGFNFRDPRSDTLFTDVHYEGEIQIDHTKTRSNSCNLTLIKRPV